MLASYLLAGSRFWLVFQPLQVLVPNEQSSEVRKEKENFKYAFYLQLSRGNLKPVFHSVVTVAFFTEIACSTSGIVE